MCIINPECVLILNFRLQMEARLAKDSGNMWIAAASQDAQVELQNAEKASLQEVEEDKGSSPEHREQKHEHDSSEL